MMYLDDDNINFVLAKARRAIATSVCQSFYRGNWNLFGTLKSYFRETNERSILRRLNSYYQLVVRWLQCLLIMKKSK